MSFDIKEFKSELGKHGVAKQSHFLVDFPVSQGSSEVLQSLSFRCDQAELPGQQVTTVDHRVYGPGKKVAYGNVYSDITFSMVCSTNLREKVFFDQWIERITGNPGRTSTDQDWNVQYFKDYASNMFITQYDPSTGVTPTTSFVDVVATTVGLGGVKDILTPDAASVKAKPVHRIELINAFPVTVTPLTLNHGSDEVHRISVTMTYQKWRRIDIGTPEEFETNSGETPLKNWLGAIGTAVGIGTTKIIK